MSLRLANVVGNRDNNFNLLRFAAALMVMYSHSFPLALGKGTPEPLGTLTGGVLTLGKLAVDVFFLISGFLVTGSLDQCQSIMGFAWARVLRIFPSLLVAIGFCTFGIGLFFTSLSWWEYLSNPEVKTFLVVNSSLKSSYYFLPDVFLDNPYKKAVNGSLWTLPFEIRMYIALGLLWLLSRRFFNLLIPIIAIFAVITHLIIVGLHEKPTVVAHFARLGSFFAMGALCYVLRERIPLQKRLFWLSLLLLCLPAVKSFFYCFYVVALPYAVLFLAYIPKGLIRNFNRFGDYSYGLYIYAFPVQQSVAALWKGVQAYQLFALAFGPTLILAILSWHLLEGPALRLKSAYEPLARLGNRACGSARGKLYRLVRSNHAITGKPRRDTQYDHETQSQPTPTTSLPGRSLPVEP